MMPTSPSQIKLGFVSWLVPRWKCVLQWRLTTLLYERRADDALRDALLGCRRRHRNVDDLLHGALLNSLRNDLHDFHGLLLNLRHGNVIDDLVDVLSLGHLSCFDHSLNGGSRALYHDGDIDQFVDVLHLRHVHSFLGSLECGILPLRCNWYINDSVKELQL